MYMETHWKLTFAFNLEFGINDSAIRLRRKGSTFKQCKADSVIDMSDSSLWSKELKNTSAPVNQIKQTASVCREVYHRVAFVNQSLSCAQIYALIDPR